jgi:hypothetical protein
MPEKHGAATPSQLKEDIDSGRTRDKVAVFDPAAAPLGTDEEAAGTPTPGWAIEAERRRRAGNPDPNAQANGPASSSVKWMSLTVLLLFLAASAIAVSM